MDIFTLSAFALYFTTLALIGFSCYQKSFSASDFMLGNRSVNYWITAIATQASDMGAWLFIGLPPVIYANGFFQSWEAIGLICCMWANWHFIAPRLRKKTAQQNSLTLSSYFADEFGDTHGIIRITSALLSLVFFTFYIASGLVALGRLFDVAFGISYHTGIILSMGIAMLYTLIGGFVAVAWCDFFQGLFLLAMIILVPSTALWQLGGFAPIVHAAQSNNISFSLLPSLADLPRALLLAFSWGLGYFGQPHILVNFMGIKNPKNIRYAKYIGISWQALVLTSSVSIGLVAIGFFPEGLANSELLFIIMTKLLFHPFIAGLVLCGILAATLSTMDSHILVSGSVVAEDLWQRIMHKKPSSQTLVWLSRIGSCIVSLIALTIAWGNNDTVHKIVNYAWSGLGSTFGPLVITSLYTNRVTQHGALAGLLVGGITAGIWPYFGTDILPLIPGFTASMLAIGVVSMVTKK